MTYTLIRRPPSPFPLGSILDQLWELQVNI